MELGEAKCRTAVLRLQIIEDAKPPAKCLTLAEFDLERYEEICEKLARRQILGKANGDTTSQYRFTHAFYRKTIYDRLTPQRRSALHLRVGPSLEAVPCENPETKFYRNWRECRRLPDIWLFGSSPRNDE